MKNKKKKFILIGISLSLMANLSPQVYAGDLVAFPQNKTSVVIPQNSSIVKPNSTDFSMKSIEDKMSNILNPAKKEGVNKINRKQLVTDDSGSCGDGVTYTFTASTGELKISGSGAMTDYLSNIYVPWYSYSSSITSLVIENGVTSIGKIAFFGCKGLTSVTIPNSVTSIGYWAFEGCSGLTSVTIGNGVTSIGYDVFYGCSNLTQLIYTGTTEPKFYNFPFGECNNLNEVEVSNRYKKDTFCNIPVNRSLTVVSLCGDGKQQYFDSNAKKIIVCKNPTNRCKYQPRSFTLFNIGLLPI